MSIDQQDYSKAAKGIFSQGYCMLNAHYGPINLELLPHHDDVWRSYSRHTTPAGMLSHLTLRDAAPIRQEFEVAWGMSVRPTAVASPPVIIAPPQPGADQVKRFNGSILSSFRRSRNLHAYRRLVAALLGACIPETWLAAGGLPSQFQKHGHFLDPEARDSVCDGIFNTPLHPHSAFVRERWVRKITQVLALRIGIQTFFSFLPDGVSPPPRARDVALSFLVLDAAYRSPIQFHWEQFRTEVSLRSPSWMLC